MTPRTRDRVDGVRVVRGARPRRLTAGAETAGHGPSLGPALAAPLADVDTERLHLRRFARTDIDALAVVFAKPEVWEFPFGRAFTRDETAGSSTRRSTSTSPCGVACWHAPSAPPTGCRVRRASRSRPSIAGSCPPVEVGWRFDPDVWGRGFATQGARAALDQAFGPLGLDRVCSLPQAENTASVRVAERLGMQRTRR